MPDSLMTANGQLPVDFVATGWELLAAASWQAAYDAFAAAVERDPTAVAMEGLGLAAWWLDRADEAFRLRERAFQHYTRQGDRRGAARVAVWLSMDHFTRRGEYAIATGWLQRAGRLLDGLEAGPEHALSAIWDAHMAIMVDRDTHRARLRYAEAAALAHALDVVDLHVLAMAGEGFARVCEGEVGAGMRLLDEATIAVVSGEISDPDALTLSYCYMIYACERVRDLERAAQWCARLQEIATALNYPAMFALCRTHFAGILIAQGKWIDAELALDGAIDELTAAHPAMAAEGIAHLADLRIRQGRVDEASALLQRLDSPVLQAFGKLPSLLVRAHLLLDQDNPAGAGALAERALRILQSGDRLSQIAALDVLVQAQLRLQDTEGAARAVAELQQIAAAVNVAFVRALANLNEGRLLAATGAFDEAGSRLEDAVDLFDQIGMPYEAAQSRLELADVWRKRGQAALARVERGRAQEMLLRLGAPPTSEPTEPRDAERPLTRREREVLSLVARGLSDREIAVELGLSEHTIHRHIANTLTKLALPSRASAVAQATRRGLI